MCFELGLHREAMYRAPVSRPDPADVSSLSPRYEESEVRRRCFWSVYALDRLVFKYRSDSLSSSPLTESNVTELCP